MAYSEEQARRDIVDICHRLYEKGWVANHDGNASIRLAADRIVATPTAVSKGEVEKEMLIVLDGQGQKIEGTRRSFSEFALHLKCYQERDEVMAVLHAHPPTAGAFAVSGQSLNPPFMAEPVVSLGANIPTTDFALPYGEAGAAVLLPHIHEADALILRNHGVITVGPDLWTAFYRMELVEHLAKIKLGAMQLGGPIPLTEAQLAPLLAKRKKAGLGPKGKAGLEKRFGTSTFTSACSGQKVGGESQQSTPNAGPSSSTDLDKITELVTAELTRLLAK